MPTSTLNGMDLFNAGPMTTTWTQPASCTSGARLAGVARTELLHPPQYFETCDFDDWLGGPRQGNCAPEGEQIDDYIRSQTDSGNPLSFIHYFSPGLHCPASWTTAGVAEKGENGSLSATGIFSMTDFTVDIVHGSVWTVETETLPTSDPWPNKLAQALYEGETAVACCPSGFTVDAWGACYSNFPIESIQSSTLCVPIYSNFEEEVPNTFTYIDEVVTGMEWSATGTSPQEIASTLTLIFADETSEPSDLSDDVEWAPRSQFTGHTQVYMVMLVRGADDDESGGDDTDDGSDDNEDGAGNGDNGNAGSSRQAGLNASLATLAAAWGVAGLLGTVLMARF